jgi:hypothetical protein
MTLALKRIVSAGTIIVMVVAFEYLQPANLRAVVPQPSKARSLNVSQVSAPGAAAAAFVPPTNRAHLDRYCVRCHNDRSRAGGLTLEKLDMEQVGPNAAVWETVVRKLRARAMPPAGLPRPDETTYEALVSSLENALDQAAAAHPNPGRPAIHRLNRTEYTNAIRDLLFLEINAQALLPGDDVTHGFDNSADILTISTSLLERYLAAARRISRLAVGDPSISPVVETYRTPKLLIQADRTSEELPFASRGGMAIRHHFPLDGEYVIRVRLTRTMEEFFPRLSEPQDLEVRLDGQRISSFAIGKDAFSSEGKFLARGARYRGVPTHYEQAADSGLEVRVEVKAGTHVVGVAFRNKRAAIEGFMPEYRPNLCFWGICSIFWPEPPVDVELGVDTVDIGGPYGAVGTGSTKSRQRIFVCRPRDAQSESSCAQQILTTLARRAFRRPVRDTDIRPLLAFYQSGRSVGGFDNGIQKALERLLVDPEFLFRLERDPQNVPHGTAYQLSDVELASRLSFFLWSSIPDDDLLELAERQTLSNPAVLEHQVRRMLADERALALTTNFAAQWLYLRNVRSVTPDTHAFPEFDDNLREAFQQETTLFLASQLQEDRPVMDLFSARYTFVNERLARHYGLPNIYGNHFRRVTFEDDRRAGLLGHGSILTVTSHAHRTSPVLRGKWLLENFMGMPPPAPPPDVPALPENGEGGAMPTSVRERLEQHRKNPTCASCHSTMDPLGFALENFDGLGKWRETSEGGKLVDAVGTLPDGTTFNGPAELRMALRNREYEFARTVTEKLLIYALGRGLEHFDGPAVRRILRESTSANYSWSSIILGIVKSPPFQMRRSPELPVVSNAH